MGYYPFVVAALGWVLGCGGWMGEIAQMGLSIWDGEGGKHQSSPGRYHSPRSLPNFISVGAETRQRNATACHPSMPIGPSTVWWVGNTRRREGWEGGGGGSAKQQRNQEARRCAAARLRGHAVLPPAYDSTHR